jgi:hypothetical protein
LTDFQRFVVKKLKKDKKALILKAYEPIKAEADKIIAAEASKKAEAQKKADFDIKKKLRKGFRTIQKKQIKSKTQTA